MSLSFYAAGMPGELAERERSTAARTVLIAGSAKAALTMLLGVGFVAGCASVLFMSWPLGAQLAVLTITATNALLLRRLCGALHNCARDSLRELSTPSPESPQ